MTSPKLRALQRQLGIQPAKAAPAATPADDLAAQIGVLIGQLVAKHTGGTPPKPQQGSRLHDLERRLAMTQAGPVDAPMHRLAALDAQLAALGHAAPVNPPARPLREVFQNIPEATKISSLSAPELVAPPPRQRLIVTGRDANSNIKTLTFGEEGKPDLDLMIRERDGNNHIAAIQVNQRLFRVFRDANGHIAEVVS